MTIHVGTSGWQYADWRGPVYPTKLAQRLWLTAYAQRFDTVEVNATFYRLPQLPSVQRWIESVPARFVMTVKASRYLTHVKRLAAPEEPVARLLDRIAPLRDRGLLGPVLLQLPPRFSADADLLARTLDQFPADVRVAVEPRDASWFTPAVRAVLIEHHAALVWADRNGRAVTPLWETCDWRYLRLHHGRNGWGYDDRDLRRWARRLRDTDDGYIYANNDPGGAAVIDAERIRELITRGPHTFGDCGS
ncbi:MAG TPA: DUF72 domain-containing protein [Mycobacteriales bacterium]|nr:DUF72 domain-containing protein [Mycobacteriales bacterium]